MQNDITTPVTQTAKVYPDTMALAQIQSTAGLVPNVPVLPATTPPPASGKGYQTSEFWLTLAAVVLTDAQPYVQNWGTAAKLVSLGLGVLAALGYVASRTYVKTRSN